MEPPFADQSANGDHDSEHDVPLATPKDPGVVPRILLPYYDVLAGRHRYMLVCYPKPNNGHSPLGATAHVPPVCELGKFSKCHRQVILRSLRSAHSTRALNFSGVSLPRDSQ